MNAEIYQGEVTHKRVSPVQHKLNYRVFSLMIDVDQLKQVSTRTKLFSVGRWNLFSLCQRDHGYKNDRSISDFAWDIVAQSNLSDRVKRIRMLFYPRILGFAFNPLTTYFCEDSTGEPVLMIYEVRNTFGENLTYVLAAGPKRNGAYAHGTKKNFYVSPFNDVSGDYHFHIRSEDLEKTVGVALKVDGQPVLRTHFRGKATDLTDKALLHSFFAYPLMTMKIIFGIHWEALRLWRKGMTLTKRPPAPLHRIEFEDGRRMLFSQDEIAYDPEIRAVGQ